MKIRKRHLSLVVCLGAAGHAARPLPRRPGVARHVAMRPADPVVLEVTLHPSVGYQTIRGFGASDAWTTQFVGAGWPEEKRRRIADLLFSRAEKPDGSPAGIGLSVWRFNIGAGSAQQGDASGITDPWRRAESFLGPDGRYDWTRAAGQRWFLRAAKARGVETFVGFANSPPVAFTRNRLSYSSGGDATNLARAHVADYAAYLRDVVQRLDSADGVHLDDVSPVNEPQWDWLRRSNQEGSPWRNTEIHDVAVAIDSVFRAARLRTRVEIPEAGRLDYLYSDADRPDRGRQLRAFFDRRSPTYVGGLPTVAHGVAAHSYFTTYPAATLFATRARLRDSLRALDPSLELWMSEYCILENNPLIRGRARDLGMDAALYAARVIHADLAVAGASAWEWWLGVSSHDYKDGLVYVDRDTHDGAVHDSKLLWAFGNWSRFVRPGMRRIGLTRSDGLTDSSASDGVLISAYLDPTTRRTVVVAVNEGAAPVALRLRGAAGDRLRRYVTSADPRDDLRFAGEQDAARAEVLPARSIVTLVADPAATPAPPGYELVWHDEFDGEGRPDTTNWAYERGFVRNRELQWYQPENARVHDGRLVIEARRERHANPDFDPHSVDWRRERPYVEYTSASLTTRGLRAWRYGRFEMRARIDVRPGSWPAFWTLGVDGEWPACGEVDIMEYYRAMLLANFAWADSLGGAVWSSTRTPIDSLGGAAWAARFHVWRMDWDEHAIRLYVDDRLLNTVDVDRTWNRNGDGRNPFRQPHHIILNLAIGGTQGGDPANTVFPVRYEVDWVRVYQRVRR